MTIIFFSRLFYPHIGGVEKHVLEISKELQKKGHSIIVITEQHEEKLKVQETYKNIKIYRIPLTSQNWFKKFNIWFWLWNNRNLFKKADIVHCHDVFFWYFPFRFLYLTKKVYTSFHGYETVFPPSQKAKIVRKVSELLSNGNIIVGEYIKKWYGTKTKFVTYGGTDESRIKNHESRIIKNRRLKILLIGRLEQDIGVRIYLQALDELKKRGVQYTFGVCGDGSLRKSAEQYGKVHGFVEYIIPFIQKADIIFASSYLSILSALINKKLVFSTYTNSLKKDYLKKSPFSKYISIENSAKDLSDKIQHYPDFKQDREQGYAFAKTQTWGSVTNMYLALWNI